MSLGVNRFFSHYKKKIKTSLWKKVSKKSRKKINALTAHHTIAQENLMPSAFVDSVTESTLIRATPSKVSTHHLEDFAKLIYIYLVYLNSLYLQYETNKVDFCIYAIQKNPILADAFQLSYNAFRAKFYRLLVISGDQGENFSLALNKPSELLSLLTYFIRFLFPPLAIVGGIIRMGINELNKKIKSRESKNSLTYCKTDENFTKIVSLLFSTILVRNLPDEEDLDAFVKSNFSIFWKILQEHAEFFLKKEVFSENRIEKIWAYCFCLFESSVIYNSRNTSIALKLDSKPKLLTYQKDVPPYQDLPKANQATTHFFDIKKIPDLPVIALNNLSQFWKNKTHLPLLKNSKHFSELIID